MVALGTSIVALNSLSADTTIDTSGDWLGSVNAGWYGSGQSITVPTMDAFFQSLTVYADAQAAGQVFTFTIFDAVNGGSVLFPGVGVLISAGANTITINQAFAAGSVIYAEFDYNGYSGPSLHFNDYSTYAGGNSSFGPVGDQSSYYNLDHRFVAKFSGSAPSVPDSGVTLGLLGLGLIGLFGLRRKFVR
jgi:hypothetical protein